MVSLPIPSLQLGCSAFVQCTRCIYSNVSWNGISVVKLSVRGVGFASSSPIKIIHRKKGATNENYRRQRREAAPAKPLPQLLSNGSLAEIRIKGS